jgi:hypothetical protein
VAWQPLRKHLQAQFEAAPLLVENFASDHPNQPGTKAARLRRRTTTARRASEFLYALRRINWDGPILLDQFPFREDPVAAARASVRTLKALDRLLDRVDTNQLKAAQDAQDALAAQRLIQDLLIHD